ncbi:MAG: RidA family protein [Dehalococcoidia bacterium]
MTPEEKLVELGLSFPPQGPAAGNFLPCTREGNIVYLSGHGPSGPDGSIAIRGRLGADLTIEQGYEAAKLTAMSLLRSLKEEIGELDRVKRILKLLGMVRCTEDFGQTPSVINGASDLFVEIFGDRGRHARSAVGLYELPFQMAVEIEMVVAIKD